MSGTGDAAAFMRAWGEGHGKPHARHGWGEDECDRCTADTYEPWDALVFAASLAWPDCCDSHINGRTRPNGMAWCCDENDCGPCCENCPTCPTVVYESSQGAGSGTANVQDHVTGV